jgi:hypothetical protein
VQFYGFAIFGKFRSVHSCISTHKELVVPRTWFDLYLTFCLAPCNISPTAFGVSLNLIHPAPATLQPEAPLKMCREVARCVCIYIYNYVCAFLYACTFMHICMYACMHVCLCMCSCVYARTCVCIQ